MVREAANFQPPAMQVMAARVQETSADSSLALVRFEVLAENPNPQAVPIQAVAYSVEAGGVTVFSGVRDAQRTIPGFGAMRFELPASVPASAVAAPLTLRSQVGYRKPGALADTLWGLELVRPVQAVGGTASAAP
jgi:LEA14-like dessication related protein